VGRTIAIAIVERRLALMERTVSLLEPSELVVEQLA